MRSLTLAGLLACSIALPAHAQSIQSENGDPEGDFAIVGAAGTVTPDYEGSDDYRLSPVPGAAGRVGGIGFQLAGNRLSVDLMPDILESGWKLQAGPLAAVNFNRTSPKSIDQPEIAALGDVGTAIEVGGYIGIAKTAVVTSEYDRISLTLSYRHDVNGVHDSGVWTPTLSYLTPLSRKALVSVFVSADHVENAYADTYYSITPAGSVASGLPVYDADGGWKNWGMGLGGAYALSGDLTGGLLLVGGVGYRRLLGDFADSPVVGVGSADQWLGVAGLAYSF
ncbi:MipA/OmpV family protein [Stakelama tenebrarum]|uniref:MipA/OmpV family protein n=1 Tax=Stakelama tenebrarum TaxID=2711215 RepID=A0A6G6Y1A4_9SPHN|nr:MipA/OmpV family protein [Sphingosinithalassobacter tenebrarum]QIG78679.1 MipA/OmpV family protein [Sphingosinithalassobacter tenebrarum]